MYWIGIDLGGTNIVTGLVDENKNMIDREEVKTRVPRPVEAMADDMVRMVDMLLRRNRLDKSQIRAVGVGVPVCAVVSGVVMS